MASAPASEAGSASAVGDVGGGLGNALSLAFLGSLSAVIYRSTLQAADLSEVPGPAREAAGESIGGAAAVAESLPGEAAAELTRAANTAFTVAVQSGYGVAALVLVPLGALVLWLLRHVRLDGTDPAGDDGAAEGTGGTGAAEAAGGVGGSGGAGAAGDLNGVGGPGAGDSAGAAGGSEGPEEATGAVEPCGVGGFEGAGEPRTAGGGSGAAGDA